MNYLSVEEIVGFEISPPSQNNNQEGKTDEKTSLNRIDGKWIGFQR
jgi:hypothetical protein